MKKPIEELDLDFSMDMSGIYVVVDSTTNIEILSPTVIQNDAAAVGAFVKFMEEQKEKKAPFSRYVLKSVALYSVIDHRIVTGESYDIISDDEDYEEYFKTICDTVYNKEEA